MRIANLLESVATLEIRADHVGFDRARAEQRDVDDEVLEAVGLEAGEQLALARGLDLKAPERFRRPDELERRLVVVRNGVDIEPLARGALDLRGGMSDRRQHPHPEDVELDQPELLDVVLVGLKHREALKALLHRDPVLEVRRRQDHPRRMKGEMAGEAVDREAQLEQPLELTRAQVGPGELGEPLDRPGNVARPHPGKRLGDEIDLLGREPEGLADLADRHAGPEGVDHAAHRGLLGPVGVEDVSQDLLATMGLDVDVDVGELVASRVHEALEQEVVAHRIDVGDPEHVAHKRARRAPPAGASDPERLPDVGDDVGDEQEIRREACVEDDPQLVLEAILDRPGDRSVPPASALEAAPGEEPGWGLPRRHGYMREVIDAEIGDEVTRLGDAQGFVCDLGMIGEQAPHLGGRLETVLGVGPQRLGLHSGTMSWIECRSSWVIASTGST